MTSSLAEREQRKNATLWMGDLEPYMDDNFIVRAFKSALTRADNVVRDIKYPLNRMTGTPSGYCFVEFLDPSIAESVLARLNGQPIPNSNPVKRFKLNTTGDKSRAPQPPSWSIWVGDLDPAVDEETLLSHFSKKYRSAMGAKIVTDKITGLPRGFAFVRFGDQSEQQRAMMEMNNTELRGRSIKIRSALTPKDGKTVTSSYPPPPPSYPPQASHQGMYGADYSAYQNMMYNNWYQQQHQPAAGAAASAYQQYSDAENPDALVEQVLVDDPQQINKDFVNMSGEVYNVLYDSRWFGSMHPQAYELYQHYNSTSHTSV